MEDQKFLELTKKYLEAFNRYHEKETKLFELAKNTPDMSIALAEVAMEDLIELDDLENQLHKIHKEWLDYQVNMRYSTKDKLLDAIFGEVNIGWSEYSKRYKLSKEKERNPTPEDHATRELLKDLLREILNDPSFQQRDRDIIKMRFGLEDGVSHTLEEVGAEFGVTRERIRQIEAKTLEKLKNHPQAYKIKEFLKYQK